MLTRLKRLYRVDNVPRLIRPFFLGFSYVFGSIQYFLFHFLVHFTSRIEFIGDDPRESDAKCVYALWHSEVFALFTALLRVPQLAVINHPYWYMKPIHVLIGLFGVDKIFLGSTGHGGKEAAMKLAQELKLGQYSTFINPDGPSGPPMTIKKGIFHIASQSQLPIVPVKISARPKLRVPSWDKKLIPLPFGKITVRFGKPIHVTENLSDEGIELLKRELSAQLNSV